MSGATWRLASWSWAALLVATWTAGCEETASDLEQEKTRFAQLRHESELLARVQTLQAKLEDCESELALQKTRNDELTRELMRNQNLRAQDLKQHELALRLNSEMKKQIEDYRNEIRELHDAQDRIRDAHDALAHDVPILKATIDDLKRKNAELTEQLRRLQP